MKNNLIKVKIEKAKDGSYWGTTQNIPGIVSADGSTLEELKENLKDAIELYIETAEGHNK
jgi:predicted RNase H-like HicB family nuclease